MRLKRAGREWLKFATTDPEIGDLSVSFDERETWHPLEAVIPPSPTRSRVLVAGPDASGNPPNTVVVTAGTHRISLRMVAGSEVIIREAPDHLIVE